MMESERKRNDSFSSAPAETVTALTGPARRKKMPPLAREVPFPCERKTESDEAVTYGL